MQRARVYPHAGGCLRLWQKATKKQAGGCLFACPRKLRRKPLAAGQASTGLATVGQTVRAGVGRA